MAYELQIRDSEYRVKQRSPWAAALLPIITLGIYHLVWWYRVNRELRDFGRARGYDLGQNPTLSLLALFPGGLIVVPALVSYWRGTKRSPESPPRPSSRTPCRRGCPPSPRRGRPRHRRRRPARTAALRPTGSRARVRARAVSARRFFAY
jgi:hypothetical protein